MYRILDLYCGAGGAGMGYHQAGFEVVGVDIAPQPHYPFAFVQMDAVKALEILLAGGFITDNQGHRWYLVDFDAIHASPPCQAYCALKTMPNARSHEKLIERTRVLLQKTGKPWVIENVFGAPLKDAFMLCGSMFQLKASDGYMLKRHRYFETNPRLFFLLPPCSHGKKTVGVYGAKARDIAREKRHYSQPKEIRDKPVGVVLPKNTAFEAMNINWMNMDELSEAIPPAYTRYIGKYLLDYLERNITNIKCEEAWWNI